MSIRIIDVSRVTLSGAKGLICYSFFINFLLANDAILLRHMSSFTANNLPTAEGDA
jgi:hypothetical protein